LGEGFVNSGERGSRGEVELRARVEARVFATGEGEGNDNLRAKSGVATAGWDNLAAFLDVVTAGTAMSLGDCHRKRAKRAPRSPTNCKGEGNQNQIQG
jgi:hypothetical protein